MHPDDLRAARGVSETALPCGSLAPLISFCVAVDHAITGRRGDQAIVRAIKPAFQVLLRNSDWLGDAWRRADGERYQQHALHVARDGRFSVVSFVWGPGQQTPVHDHGVWGLVGVIEGAEVSQRYRLDPEGRPRPVGAACRLEQGDVDLLLPGEDDLHQVSNAFHGRPSISIHVYGADIGRLPRRRYDAEGIARAFVSGYSATPPLLASLDAAPDGTPAR